MDNPKSSQHKTGAVIVEDEMAKGMVKTKFTAENAKLAKINQMKLSALSACSAVRDGGGPTKLATFVKKKMLKGFY